jgi:hypothetical protein
MSTTISNPSGDRQDKIANAARVLGRSSDRKKVFKAVYTTKKKVKTISDISLLSGIKNRVRVLQETKRLRSEDIIQAAPKVNGETAYQKIDFYTHNRDKILALAENKDKLDRFPTKVTPKPAGSILKISIPRRLTDIKQITVDDIDTFSKLGKLSAKTSLPPMAEKKFKKGLQNIFGEKGTFNDWGGETDDLYSTRLSVGGRRISVAIALKGKATKGILTPKKMGKNGDQIQRLFRSPAQVFLIQYHGSIDQSVIEQMRTFAIVKSLATGQRIYFGVIDGSDSQRLVSAYPKKFK